ncbi:hypothetical protein PTSG_06281 [Salpingoeca rosetta]|uniref:Mannosylglycerate hydrolase MGH1-like glycoside hydrolase domain-containing protein n=1 Tax=Salpingoeca rosetta (strain ATCC 50818 / BSB-021) TaxID=946362 RepID=F2UCG5_SALR5|nr:uncharacterized protein PTSG_06281 [Salpingoeca rosetta]EGD74272.1 hypothetical protein PTSG_06281 [Salpingoeca rosetta]|eukprot:XP_004993172.1 hypothetical protein PTSG_06281 [Salpingoeca rosetta]
MSVALGLCVVVCLAVAASGVEGRQEARRAAATCADLAGNDTYQLSFEGSWSYVTLAPASDPTSMGALGYRVFSDWSPGTPLFPEIVTMAVEDSGIAGEGDLSCDAIADGGYEWRPDYAVIKAKCGKNVEVHVKVAYTSSTTTCAQYTVSNLKQAPGSSTSPLSSSPALKLVFSGKAPNFLGATSAAQVNGTSISVATKATMPLPPYTQQMHRYWRVQTSLNTAPSLDAQSHAYAWSLSLPAAATKNVTFCLSEYDSPPSAPAPLAPVLDTSNTTTDINDWLAQLPVPPASAHIGPTEFKMYYNAWFQFWFNTERAGGEHWVRPVITPSMSRYARGLWLWDTGFHVFALLASPGSRALAKAKDQLTVLTTAGVAVGHIPRVVGATVIEKTTQPPGILTWAALVIYNRTRDDDFLRLAFNAFAQNNDWFYAQRLAKDGSGLCLWAGEDSGWDTSPRWDQGPVEAIDLNTWLHMDHLLLAHMAKLLGNATAHDMWTQRAHQSAAAIQRWLWDDSKGVFWDRLPAQSAVQHDGGTTRIRSPSPPGSFVDVVTPAPFWALLGNVANASQAESVSSVLLTPSNLMTPYHMPCVGRSEKVFDPTDYWRGPVWVNVNWLAGVGLDCYGQHDRASMLRNATVAVVNGQPEPREYYNPLTGDGLGAKRFSWTGAVYIVTLQEMAGNSDVANTLHTILQCRHSK